MIDRTPYLLQALELIKAGAIANSKVGLIASGSNELNERKFIFVKWARRCCNVALYALITYLIFF